MRAFQVAAAAASLLIVASQAQALTPQVAAREPTSERISTTNVNFRDAAQVDAVYKRLQRAALFVCGSSSYSDRVEREENRACAEAAVRDAVNKLNRPMLTAAYQTSGAPMLAQGY